MKLLAGISLLFFYSLFPSCRVAEKNIAGTYHPSNSHRTRLILKKDKTFELSLLDPATDSLLLPSKPSMNLYTTGTWEYLKKILLLKSVSTHQPVNTEQVNDSITRFTAISSFNFWNRYGEPVSIRSIIIPPARTKPHFGNSLYFFNQDFKETDTLKFYFEGYPAFNFPGTVPPSIGNNMHKVTLYEPYQSAVLPDPRFKVRKNKLIHLPNQLKLKKSK